MLNNQFWFGMINLDLFGVSFDRDEERSQSKASGKKVTFDLSGDEDSEGEDIEDIFGGKSQTSKSESKSSFEKRQQKVTVLNAMQ